MQIKKIGLVHSCFKAKFGTPRQSQIVKDASAYIRIEKKWEPTKCLKGLEDFSHAWVLFYFHDNQNLSYKPVVKPPRLGRKGVGVFASRSPVRPNPIGLSLVKIDKIEKDCIYISGVDLIDGTPVLDIKPYIHAYDSVEESRSGWLEDLESEHLLDVEFSEDALQTLQVCPAYFKDALRDILKQDIRNRNDKSSKNQNKILGFYFEDWDVKFTCVDNKVKVLNLEKIKARPGSRFQKPAQEEV